MTSLSQIQALRAALQAAGFKAAVWQRDGISRIYLEYSAGVRAYIQLPRRTADLPATDYPYEGCFVGVQIQVPKFVRPRPSMRAASHVLLHNAREDILNRIAHITRREEEIYYA